MSETTTQGVWLLKVIAVAFINKVNDFAFDDGKILSNFRQMRRK